MLDFLRPWFPLVLIGALGLWVNHLQDGAYEDGYSKAQTEGTRALNLLRGEHQAKELADAKAAAKRLQEEQTRNDELATDLAEQQRQHRKTTDRLSGEIARVNDLYRQALDTPPEPLPACMFTRGFVRVWNEATGASTELPAATVPGGANAQSTEARTLDQLPAGIGRADILAHHVRYAEQCRNTAAQLDALIDAVQGTK
ncbi:hypothetical protein SAMN05216588_12622 [Pseudomonas flavescens]|uniref:Bacteriophage Rz lysis protein n=1 Tax=Phytopseudomonas flavescens TaxID=29435 RepID=A0A1G8NUP7_9GAMM|nr:hypothetical protein [Pseudomonas flavescens]SDI83942.1 hypothetical protein SAMN05216588_12622 [Pseudomonas flavescens]